MQDADLSRTGLWAVTGNGREIKSLQTGIYPVAYTNSKLQIGCEQHDIESWFQFDDKRILTMDGKKALTFWRKWRPILAQILEIETAEEEVTT